MKKILILFIAFAFNRSAKCQNVYGSIAYPHANQFLSSGTVTSINPGFLNAGYVPITTIGQPNFSIDHRGISGNPGTLPFDFQKDYRIYLDGNCSATPAQALQTSGVSIIENSWAGCRYTGVAATSGGLTIFKLDNGGVPIFSFNYIFPPSGANNFSKPVICHSNLYPNEFLIAGSYDGKIYVAKVDTQLTTFQQFSSNLIPNFYSQPTGILEEPFTGSNLITVVGTMASNSSGQDGFLLQTNNPLSGALSLASFQRYDQTVGSNSNNTFNSICVDNSGTPGFLVGGGSESPLGNPGKAWMLKLSPTGSVLWSSVIDGTTDPSSGKINAVLQRYSPYYARYENYGACEANSGITIYRLDKNGVPLSAFGSNDEFVYSTGSFTRTWPIALTYLDSASTSWDAGLHIYGNFNTTPGDYFFVEACLNGPNGCDPVLQLSQYDPALPNRIPVSNTNGLSMWPCPNGGVAVSSVFAGLSYICPQNPFPSGGGNGRLNGANSIQKNTLDPIAIGPNPAKLWLQLDNLPEHVTAIQITDFTGRTIQTFENQSLNGNLKINIDRTTINEGLYLIKITGPKINLVKKIVIE